MNRFSRGALAIVCLAIGVIGGFYANARLQGQNPPPPLAIPAELTSYRDIVKHVAPAVVSIETKAKARNAVPKLPMFDGAPQLPEMPSVGFGSGFIVDPTGIVLTNFHVVDGAESVEVSLPDGRKFASKDIRFDRKTDLAIIRLESKEALPFLELGDSDKVEVGDRVLAIGAPFGLTGSVTHGIISAKSRNLRMNVYEDFLQTDAAINPGNSGGPLISLDGNVIGINSAIKSRSGGFQGVGLAISSNLVRQVKEQLLRDGVVRRGYIGVQIKELTPEIAKAMNLGEQSGVVVSRVMTDSPAEKGGLQAGDVVLSIGGKAVRDGKEMQKIVAGLVVKQPTDVAIIRDGEKQVVKLTIEEQPDEFGSERVPAPLAPKRENTALTLEKFGLGVADLTPELAEQLGFKQAFKGSIVVRVEVNSLAEQAGLVRNMVIVRVDGKVIDSATTLRDALALATPEKGALLQVRSAQGGTDFLLMKVQ